MSEILGSEYVVKAAGSRRRSIKKTLRMAGAAAISATMVGVFALPVYATAPVDADQMADAAYAQALRTGSLPAIAVPVELPTAEEEPVVVAAPVTATVSIAYHMGDVPAGAGAEGIVNAALAQVGWHQDCTDLVQNSLAAVGYLTSRLDGGYDMGPNAFKSVGAEVTNGEWAPGDILVWDGWHVAIYVGDGMAVHGGMESHRVGGDGWTTFTTATATGQPSMVVRVA